MANKRPQTVPEGCPLTGAQFDIVQMLCDGLTYDEIALRRKTAASTVRTICHGAYQRLGVTSSTTAVAAMFRNGWFGWVRPEPTVSATQTTPKPAGPEPFPLTPFMRAYLAEFDKFLSGTGADCMRARRGMSVALVGMRNGG